MMRRYLVAIILGGMVGLLVTLTRASYAANSSGFDPPSDRVFQQICDLRKQAKLSGSHLSFSREEATQAWTRAQHLRFWQIVCDQVLDWTTRFASVAVAATFISSRLQRRQLKTNNRRLLIQG